jgi:hypothetical protein
MKLTKRMYELLKGANLQAGEINDVPMSSMYGLEARGLVSPEWRVAVSTTAQQITGGGSFPWYKQVKLTTAGIRAARGVQGMSNLPSEPEPTRHTRRGGGVWIHPRT